MVIFEIVALLVIAVVLITAVQAIGRPMAELLTQKTIFQYKQLGSEAEVRLNKRVADLEEELRAVRRQLEELKSTTDFTLKLVDSKSTKEQKKNS